MISIKSNMKISSDSVNSNKSTILLGSQITWNLRHDLALEHAIIQKLDINLIIYFINKVY